jgi:hypothetical protein
MHDEPINKTALIRLADKLEGIGPYKKDGPIPRERFNMFTWTGNEVKLKDDKVLPNLPCGTAACACGWAGSDPWFRRRGFYTVYNSIKYNGDMDFSAAEKFFKISYDVADKLFSHSEDNKTPKQVAKNIRKYIKVADTLDELYKVEKELEEKLSVTKDKIYECEDGMW